MKRLMIRLGVALIAWVILTITFLVYTGRAAEPIQQEIKLSEEYSVALWACHVPQKSGRLIHAEPWKLAGQNQWAVMLDRNYDGAFDMILLFDVNGENVAPFPHYYVYDMDFNGQFDKAYVDKFGNGICQQMQEVPVNYIIKRGKLA